MRLTNQGSVYVYSCADLYWSEQYPLSDKIMKPASNPDYYEDLVRELDAAPTRSRLEALWTRWKGIIRFK